MIPKNYQAKEGIKLTDDLIVGKHISSGLQGGVYDLLNVDGSKANMVFKVSFSRRCRGKVETICASILITDCWTELCCLHRSKARFLARLFSAF